MVVQIASLEVPGTPFCRIYVGDCREILPQLQSGGFDLIFADPPFRWGVKYDTWKDDMPEAEYLQFTLDWLRACHEALRPGGALWVNIPDDIVDEVSIFLRKSLGMTRVNWCIWSFRFGQNCSTKFIAAKTHVLYFVKGMIGRTWNPDEILVPSDRASKYNDPRTRGKKVGKDGLRVPLDVWGSEGDGGEHWGRVVGNSKERRPLHENQLPERYLERVIRATSNPADLVLDPFIGSGGTCTVARALGRRSIGIEVSPAYAASAVERVKKGPVHLLGTAQEAR